MWRFPVLLLISTVSAQIPSLGWCPDYQPMANFNMNRYLGTWYEAERYFTVSELVSRCVTTKYESTPEGRILVSNEITNTLTGYKRVMDGALQMIGREGEGRVMIKYSSLPVPYESEYSILDTDYDSYAVLWSCSGIGPVHMQNAWILTRDRLASPTIMQMAYAALERFKISRTFFVKTNQADCSILPVPAAAPIVRDTEDYVVEMKNLAIKPDEDQKAMPMEKSAPVNVPVAAPVQPVNPVVPEIPAVRSEIPKMPAEQKLIPEMEKKEIKSEKMPEIKSEKMPEIKSEKMPEIKSEKMPEIKSEKMPEMKEEKEKKPISENKIPDRKAGRKYIYRN